MELGLFLMPSHPPERRLLAGQQWDLDVLREVLMGLVDYDRWLRLLRQRRKLPFLS